MAIQMSEQKVTRNLNEFGKTTVKYHQIYI